MLICVHLWLLLFAPYRFAAVADDTPALFTLSTVEGSKVEGLMRIITPIRLSPELGPALSSEVARTREILDRFQKAGYEHAVWAVDKLPEKEEDIKLWVQTCLEAFPTPPILAIDSKLENGMVSPDPEKLKVFLKYTVAGEARTGSGLEFTPSKAKGESKRPDPKERPIHSVIVNFSKLNNCECDLNSSQAIALAKKNAELVRSLSKDKFLWLLVHDWKLGTDEQVIKRSGDVWIETLGVLADGYWIYRYRWSDWNAAKSPDYGEGKAWLWDKGKPLIRGNFQYTTTRLRPGLEKDMAENYHQRMDIYEEWIKTSKYAGYAREIGESIPNAVNVNMNFAPVRGL